MKDKKTIKNNIKKIVSELKDEYDSLKANQSMSKAIKKITK